MKDIEDGAWFAAKRYGYGSGLPLRWQGWMVMAAMLAGLLLIALKMHGFARALSTICLLTAFCLLCAAKTRGGWRWRWGDAD